ncbi:MAG: carboxylating nicotinate-nucleotide diphosphorylase [Ignavibacteria bacterium]|jgi:nicotinate-nucleotide pyrophosphorylase (carboxylating)
MSKSDFSVKFPVHSSVLRLIQFALHEDIGTGDITSDLSIDPQAQGSARFLLKQEGVVCGLPIIPIIFRQLSDSVHVDILVDEGAYLPANTVIASVTGPASALLSGERTALNFIQRMSGVATKTHQYVERIAGTNARILDTRKTIPGWRLLDKYATAVGGAKNHRVGLYDMVMIKDNHITACGGIRQAVEMIAEEMRSRPTMRVEVEAQNLQDVQEILACSGVHRVMFDNFMPDDVAKGVRLVNHALETEASGGITYDNIRLYAEAGVDYISVGAVTHSAVALDISMKLVVPRQS